MNKTVQNPKHWALNFAGSALTLIACVSCQFAAPVIFSAQVDGPPSPVALVRTNLRQTYIQGGADFAAEAMTTDGIPIFVHQVSAGIQLYIDKDADVRLESPIGTPLPSSARALFPRPGEADALGITFEVD